MKGTITAEKNAKRNNDGNNKPFVFKNDTPFINCISNISGVLTDYAEDLDVVICLCAIWLNIAKITNKQWEAYGIITEMNQIMMT